MIAAFTLAALCALALFSAQSAQGALGDRTLSKGDRGKDVRALQVLLARAGFPGRTNGVFGRRTWLKVRTIERELDLRVDGIVTRSDIRRIELALRPSDGSGGFSADAKDTRQRATVAGQEAAGAKAVLTEDGLAIPPANAPQAVKDVIEAGNRIATKPYRYGGGHGKWEDSGYDCSGSVSYALHGGDLLDSPMPSGSFTSWGQAGKGEWITIYAHGGHIYMVVAGLRFDTSGRAQTGSRWQKAMRSPSGFTVRHPKGL
ncbi:MAG: peptidoglycan-binding protein [Actinomycetota bacterium]|nr:peptidoglycan-binding protein [Actinomycetota bacterium]